MDILSVQSCSIYAMIGGKVRLDVLKEAINSTFANRSTVLYPDHALFSANFFNDESRKAFWKGFLRKIKWAGAIDFHEIGIIIRTQLMPFYREMIEKQQ